MSCESDDFKTNDCSLAIETRNESGWAARLPSMTHKGVYMAALFFCNDKGEIEIEPGFLAGKVSISQETETRILADLIADEWIWLTARPNDFIANFDKLSAEGARP